MTILETLIKLRDDLKLWATNNLKTKADVANTLAGYGITDAYTKTQIDTAIAQKSQVQIITWGADD